MAFFSKYNPWYYPTVRASFVTTVINTECTVKILKIQTPKIYPVITLKFEQDDVTVK